ncbi:FUSC family protein [Haloactinomyces albus]|uniref:Membrane protein YccC n=1 Tax=Haloactinomyces albus TaxID=1352928 RepID=A0AAE4CJK3_9ACTN|nr:FUSC family protein [Haloactinomyces albus]MDR7300115.1 putative membrane protein YccC [Haloactinomyces albus]
MTGIRSSRGVSQRMWSEWWNRFVASDPALRRLRTATRVAVSVALTLLIVFPLLAWWGQPLTSAIIGAVVAIQSSVAVNDDTDRQRRITTLLMPLPATLSLVLATVTTPLAVTHILLFLVVIFIATYIRRFGPRYFALGFVGFFGYFFAMFLRPSLPQVPAMAVAAVCGALVALVLRFVVLRDDPEGILRRGRRTLRAQVHGLLHAIRDVARSPDSAQHRRRLHRRSIRLNETALMLENTVQQLDSLDESGREVIRRRILDVELAAENLRTPLLRVIDHPSGSAAVSSALGPLLDVLRAAPSEIREASRNVADRVEQQSSAEVAMTIRRLGASLAELATATAELGTQRHAPDQSSHETGPGEEPTDEPEERESEEREAGTTEETGLRRPELRTAIQVTCATGMAVFLGQLISPNRWYWAVITAFVVFVSANSRGELLVRAWQRTAGTLLGVVAGILVASQVTGNIAAEIALVLFCVFAAFYFLGYSYAVLTFFITTMLGIIYGILGIFDVSVLETRLVETAAGAAAGVLAAMLILPTRTHSVVRNRSEDVLKSLRDLLRAAGNSAASPDDATSLRESVRDLDDRVQQLRNGARPLTNYRLRSQRSRIDRWLTILGGCAYYVRNLAAVLPTTVDMVDADTRERLAELLWALADAAESLTDEGSREFRSALQPACDQAETLRDIVESVTSDPTSLHRTLNLLDRLTQLLQDLAGELDPTTPGEQQDTAAR